MISAMVITLRAAQASPMTAAGKIAEPGLHRPALPAAWCILELDRGEERCALPLSLRHALDHAFARLIERNHLDDARLRVGIIDPKAGLHGGAHACAFTVHHCLSTDAGSGRRHFALPLRR